MNEIKVINQSISLNPISAFAEQVEKGASALKSGLDIQNHPQLETGTELLNKSKKLSSLVNKEVEALCRPLKDYKKDIDAAQKQIKGYAEKMLLPLTEVTIQLEQNIIAFHKKEAERAQAEKEAAEKAAAESSQADQDDAGGSGEFDFDDPVRSSQPVVEPPKVKGMVTSVHYNVVDPSLVPREYCSPDHVKITQAIKNGVTDIPGIEVYEQTKIRRT